MFAGLMAGLTLGLMSLGLVDLEVLVKSGRPKDRINAAKIIPLVNNQHLLLCTLLIGNSLAMEALPIFLNALVPSWVAILISVTLILIFSEILPQAVCSHYGLSVGAKMAGFVRVLLCIFYPLAYPISKLLDYLLGKGRYVLLRRSELKAYVDMHGNEAGKGGELTRDETTIICGALDLTQKRAKDAMTPISKTFSLDISSKLDMNMIDLIMSKGHSRVPIYSACPTNIIGLILVKNLIACRPEDDILIKNVTIRKIPRVHEDMPLYDILNEFQKGHSHMAVVVKNTKAGTPGTFTNVKSSIVEKMIIKKTSGPQLILADPLVTPIKTSLMHPSLFQSLSPLQNMDQNAIQPHSKKQEWHQLVVDNMDLLPTCPFDGVAVGIITMEDLIEELLQEEILDETDEYVDVHNKIKINMLPLTNSSPRYPSSISYFQRTPMSSSSPLNMSLGTPVSSSIKTSGSIPMFTLSKGKSLPSSPAQHAIHIYSSPP